MKTPPLLAIVDPPILELRRKNQPYNYVTKSKPYATRSGVYNTACVLFYQLFWHETFKKCRPFFQVC